MPCPYNLIINTFHAGALHRQECPCYLSLCKPSKGSKPSEGSKRGN
ncbi:MAG TPA: hypothetical protein PLU67_04165 [Candidatus Kapabacteria bacterium]|nr:hypothetical protein [Candidatus Kapabacteria bacterium]HOM04673.1 hypothetical protein [Candidatus Kapabacteria bacterium]HPP40082.1 hypothetical protein [Candidatus Kapabacteria bacterium]